MCTTLKIINRFLLWNSGALVWPANGFEKCFLGSFASKCATVPDQPNTNTNTNTSTNVNTLEITNTNTITNPVLG